MPRMSSLIVLPVLAAALIWAADAKADDPVVVSSPAQIPGNSGTVLPTEPVSPISGPITPVMPITPVIIYTGNPGLNQIETGTPGLNQIDTGTPGLNPVSSNPPPIGATGGSDPVYVPAVPEPASIAVLGLGLVGLAASRRKRA